jgi:hypothetical protein
MNFVTEIISSWVSTTVDGKEMYVINTISGQVVWASKSKFDTNAEQITYEPMKAGDTYTKKDGTIGTLAKDRNEFKGAGKQIVRKFDTMQILDHLVSKGIEPKFSLS